MFKVSITLIISIILPILHVPINPGNQDGFTTFYIRVQDVNDVKRFHKKIQAIETYMEMPEDFIWKAVEGIKLTKKGEDYLVLKLRKFRVSFEIFIGTYNHRKITWYGGLNILL